MRPCPWCAEEVQDAAIVCRFCNRSLSPPVPGLPGGASSPTADPAATGRVPPGRTDGPSGLAVVSGVLGIVGALAALGVLVFWTQVFDYSFMSGLPAVCPALLALVSSVLLLVDQRRRGFWAGALFGIGATWASIFLLYLTDGFFADGLVLAFAYLAVGTGGLLGMFAATGRQTKSAR